MVGSMGKFILGGAAWTLLVGLGAVVFPDIVGTDSLVTIIAVAAGWLGAGLMSGRGAQGDDGWGERRCCQERELINEFTELLDECVRQCAWRHARRPQDGEIRHCYQGTNGRPKLAR